MAVSQRAKTWVAVLIIPILLAALGYYSKNLTTAEWNKVVDYRSKYAYQLTPAGRTKALTDQVILIIIDGLRVDVSKQMAVLNSLRQKGASFTVTTGQPSLSTPGAAVLASGTYQEYHGVTTNWYEGALKVDSIEAAAKRAGLRTGVAGGKGWDELVGPYWDEKYYYEWSDQYDDLTRDASIKLVTQDPPLNFILVHYSDTDEQGHAHGGGSPEYLKAAQGIDARIGEFLKHVDLAKATVIVTADHGHVKTGGHGGWEPAVTAVPVVMAGKGVKPGTPVLAAGEGGQGDVATTIAALLGTSFPANTLGRVDWEALDLSPADRAEKALALAKTEGSFAGAYGQTLNRAIVGRPESMVQAEQAVASGDYADAAKFADQALVDLDRSRSAARASMIRAGQLGRLPVILVLALVPLTLIIWLWRKNPLLLPALGGAVLYFALYNLSFFLVHHYVWSLSAFNSEDQIMAFFNGRMIEAAGTAAAAALIFGVYTGSRRKALQPAVTGGNPRGGAGVPWSLAVAQGGAFVSLFIAYGIFLQVLLAVLDFGLDFAWYLPNLKVGFKFYLDLLQAVTTGFAALVTPVVAILGAALGGLAIFRRKETSLRA